MFVMVVGEVIKFKYHQSVAQFLLIGRYQMVSI